MVKHASEDMWAAAEKERGLGGLQRRGGEQEGKGEREGRRKREKSIENVATSEIEISSPSASEEEEEEEGFVSEGETDQSRLCTVQR
eukprot:748169-Hanusia_phi.AAC.1